MTDKTPMTQDRLHTLRREPMNITPFEIGELIARLDDREARLRRAVEACKAVLPKESCDECPTCDTRRDDMTVTHEAGCKLCAVLTENADLLKGESEC